MNTGHKAGPQWLFFFVISLAQPVRATVYFVSTNGLDSQSGLSMSAPFRTIQHAADVLADGDSVQIQPGTYREFVFLTHGGSATGALGFAGAGIQRPVIKGSEIVTNWTLYTNSIWAVGDWAENVQQVFEDGVSLAQVGWPNVYLRDYAQFIYTPPADTITGMTSGSFFYDLTNRVLYVWCSDNLAPSNHTLEVSARSHILYSDDPVAFTTFTNLQFMHCNTYTYSGSGLSGVRIGPHSLVDNCAVEWCDAEGLSLWPEGVANHCDISWNGMVGLSMGTNTVLQGSTIIGNNYRHFNVNHHAGGMKIISAACQFGQGAAGGIIDGNEIAWNYGFGVWFDYCTGDCVRVIRNNYIHHNQLAGIMMEVTKGGVICNNLIVSNYNGGILLSGSDRIRVFNNTLVANSGWVDLYVYGIPRIICDENGTSTWATVVSNEIVNNVIYDGRCTFDVGLMGESLASTQYVRGNICDYNCYYRPSDYIRMSLSGVNWWTNLADWVNGTVWDSHSISQAPVLTNSPWGLVMPGPTSPLIDRGVAIAGATTDYHRVARPLDGDANGTAIVDIGAIEFVNPAADSDGDGLADTNELAIGTSPVNRDTDGDLQSDYEEVLAGTSPIDGASRFEIGMVEAGTQGVFILRWPSADSRYYDVSKTLSLTTTFSALLDNMSATPPENAYTDTVSGVDRAFYQIKVRR